MTENASLEIALTTDKSALLDSLLRKFPHAKRDVLDHMKINADAAISHIAQTHDLTPDEAREEWDNWITLQPETRSGVLTQNAA